MENELTEEQKREAERQAEYATKLAVDRYIRAEHAFEEASNEFNGACCEMREKLGKGTQLVAKVDFTTYLVTTDSEGNFSVKKVKVLY